MYVRKPWTIRQYASSVLQKKATPSTGVTWPWGRRAFQLPLTWLPTAGMTVITQRVMGDVGMAGVCH